MPDVVRNRERFQAIRPGELAREVYVQSAGSVAVAHQRFFLAGTGRISAGLGQYINATIENPAGSGRNVIVVAITANNEEARHVYAEIVISPTTNLPTTVRPSLNSVIGSPVTAVAVLRADAMGAALAGGTSTGVFVPLQPNRTEINLPGVVISPGVTIGFDIPLGVLEAGDGSFGVYWIERDVGDA